MFRTEDFNFVLPSEFIAQSPAEPRDSSKLMVFDTARGVVEHVFFRDLPKFLSTDGSDTLVFNRSKVFPARIIFFIDGKEREIFLLKNVAANQYEALVRPGKFFKQGCKFDVDENLAVEVVGVMPDGTRLLKFIFTNKSFTANLNDYLEQIGQMPLPPYIKSDPALFDRYQTVFAKEKGSVAAPTAGLHFTPELLASLAEQGVDFCEVILHVGRGTFLPVNVENLTEHKMHSEEYFLTEEMCEKLNKAVAFKKRIVAVGTTSVRVLESNFSDKDGFSPQNSSTDIFIYPGSYQWKIVDGLITNFHLPKSTLLMLVASFLEKKGQANPIGKVLELYEIAKKHHYRFYSFGDAMLII